MECPEWHVRCAFPFCNEAAVVALIGECFTARQAEQLLLEEDTEEVDGWMRLNGLWYCPTHGHKSSIT